MSGGVSDWWRFDANWCRFRRLTEEQVRADLWRVLDKVEVEKRDKETGELEYMKLSVKSALVSNVLDALRSVAPLLVGDAPQWIRWHYKDPPLRRLVPCKNGILNIGERVLMPREPRLFTTTAVAAPWHDEPQPCPTWMDFLHRLWGDDKETIETLQEIFGYLLTSDTSQQKSRRCVVSGATSTRRCRLCA